VLEIALICKHLQHSCVQPFEGTVRAKIVAHVTDIAFPLQRASLRGDHHVLVDKATPIASDVHSSHFVACVS
jgi:hypothetical protein